MTKRMMFTLLGLGLFSQAHASDPGFYVGGGLGQTDFSGDIARQIERTYAGDDEFSLDLAVLTDDSDSAYKLFAGYRFGSWFGLELAWHDFGEARSFYEISPLSPVTPPPPGSGIEGRYDVDGPALTVFGEWDFSDSVSGMVRAGLINASLDYEEVAVAGEPYRFESRDYSDTRPTFGLGLNWRMAPRWDLRLDYDRVQGVGQHFAFFDDSNGRFDHIDVMSLNLAYRFSQ